MAYSSCVRPEAASPSGVRAHRCRSRASDSAIIGGVKDPFSASVVFRRRYVRDVTWLGLGLIAIAFGVLAQAQGWARLWSLLLLVVGLTMVAPAVRKRLRRSR